MCFSIDALSAAGDKAWRLLEDRHHWRTCIYAEAIKSGDARIADRAIAEDWAGRRLKADKKLLLEPKDKPGVFDFLMRGIFAHAVLHRFSPAPVPDKSQMLDLIGGLEPGTPWLVYLNPAGHFQALDTARDGILGNLDIAVRGEIASSAGYIGSQAARNARLMDEIYRQFLAGWCEHLDTSKMAVFVPNAEKLKSEQDYLEHIRNWQHE
ncbi:MAG: hypothetical protein Q9M29_00170 [Mariprofundaceae bacterium]|nr:hypothetical protein [Mariprofundaceae bacterium]